MDYHRWCLHWGFKDSLVRPELKREEKKGDSCEKGNCTTPNFTIGLSSSYLWKDLSVESSLHYQPTFSIDETAVVVVTDSGLLLWKVPLSSPNIQIRVKQINTTTVGNRLYWVGWLVVPWSIFRWWSSVLCILLNVFSILDTSNQFLGPTAIVLSSFDDNRWWLILCLGSRERWMDRDGFSWAPTHCESNNHVLCQYRLGIILVYSWAWHKLSHHCCRQNTNHLFIIHKRWTFFPPPYPDDNDFFWLLLLSLAKKKVLTIQL
jgi:hypothetical protein